MSILDVLNSVVMAYPTPSEPIHKQYKLLFDAVERQDLVAIEKELNNASFDIQASAEVFNHFLHHFSSKSMDLLFYCNMNYSYFEFQSRGTVLPPVFWTWFFDPSYQRHFGDALEAARSTLSSKTLDTTSTEYLSCLNMLEAYLRIHPDASFLLKESDLTRSFNQPCVEQWDQRMWGILNHCTVEQWSQFLDIQTPHSLLQQQNQNLKYLQVTLQQLVNFQTAIDNHYENNRHNHQMFLDAYYSPEGLQCSKGFQQLSDTRQQQLLKEFQRRYVDGRDRELISIYQHVLGFTPEELFLARFGSLYINADDLPWPHTSDKALHPMQDLLSTFYGVLAVGPESSDCIVEHLDNSLVLENVFEDITPSDFLNILQIHPQLAHWKDSKGNSLAHWCAVNVRLTTQWVEAFIQHPSLLEANNVGHTVRGILMEDWNAGDLADGALEMLDHYLLTQEIEVGHTQRARKM